MASIATQTAPPQRSGALQFLSILIQYTNEEIAITETQSGMAFAVIGLLYCLGQ